MGIGAEEKQWLLNEHVESALGSAFQAGTDTAHSLSVYCGALRPLKGHGKYKGWMHKVEESQDVQYEEAKAGADKRVVFKYQKKTILSGAGTCSVLSQNTTRM